MKKKCAGELAEVRSWADERIAAQTEQMELQSEQAKVVAARSKEETKLEVARLMEVGLAPTCARSSLVAIARRLFAHLSTRRDLLFAV